MKTTLYNLLFALLLLPAVACANDVYKGKYNKQKTIKKEFKVSANDLLKLDNSYGNIDIVTWDQNRVEIEVTVKTNGNDEEKVQQRLDEIKVNFSQTGGEVSAETIFPNTSNSWLGSLFGSSSNVNMEVNYRVKAPVTNNMNISNDYGSINLDELEGDLKLSCDYGKFMIRELRGNNNYLNFDYTRKSSIGFVKKAKIQADYSEFRIEEAGTVDLSADYTDAYFEKVENISFNNDYGSLSIDKLRNIKGQGDYLGVKLGMVYSRADLNMDYGSLSIDKLMPAIKTVEIDSDYTSLKIGYDPEAAFGFEVNTSYGGVKGLEGNNFNVNKRHQSGSDNYFQGYYGNSSGGQVKINSSYGSVNFNSKN
ncbi:hypothetical protein SAMN04488034_10675 [Salinimicrobium catena]|uniref:Adhesin domain-containing protein n=1 Tax=Salinimicrobium catena TaxID=390640 RepID=A0A1H5NY82_9FLAO|nr:hypothetical protein [Salinimicrobium catena]SDL59421.1 hypothetical protein SAMN04488140_10639 [Salinimicrobium catena]SEF05791.1 hypothetical protein SAMN04488034_10675 [Salinimicrobium catena]